MKKTKSISRTAFDLINQRQIKPIPKWEFLAKNWGLWLGFGLSLAVLVMGVGVFWFGFVDDAIEPYLWLIVAVIFLGLAFILFERTRQAYRYQKWQVVSLILIFGLVIGGTIFKVGLANNIDKNLRILVPFYRNMVPLKLQVWTNPKEGYLSGVILKFGEKSFELKDFSNKIWTVKYDQPLIRGRVEMLTGEEIKLIGNQTGANTFWVEEIRPWGGMGQTR